MASEITGYTYDPTGIMVRKVGDGGRLGESTMSRAPRKRRPRPNPVMEKKPPKHPDFERKARMWSWLQASYEGGQEYVEAKGPDGKSVLVPHESESPKSLERRKRMTPYKNFCKPIINKLVAYVFGAGTVRDMTNNQFAEWSQDVDDRGTSLEDFVEDAMTQDRVLGAWFVLMDTNKPNDKMTVAQAKAAGTRVIVQHVHPARVIDWAEDDSWLLAIHEDAEGVILRLWDDVTVHAWMLDEKGRVAADLGEQAHGWPTNPLRRVRGKSLISDVALLNMSYYNVDSILREELARQTFTQYMLFGISAEDVSDDSGSMLGPRRLICVNKPAQDLKLERLGADASQAESLRATMEQDRKEIYNLVGLRPPDVEVGPESGRALLIRQADTFALAERLSDDARDLEAWLSGTWGMVTGVQVEPPQYPEDFDETALQDDLRMALDMVGSEAFPPEVKAEASAQFVSRRFEGMEDEEKDELVLATREYWKKKAVEDQKIKDSLVADAAMEKQEHPWASNEQAAKIAKDHAKKK